MLTTYIWDELNPSQQQALLTRPAVAKADCQTVQNLIQRVKNEGDSALIAYTKQLDGVSISSLQQRTADAKINSSAKRAIQQAIANVTRYHLAAKPQGFTLKPAPGITLKKVFTPIQRVGLYIPGGNNTPLVSSLIMQAVPALIAGCPLRIVCTPPNANGEVDPHLLVTAKLCKIDTIYTVGGAQAIAAMAYGTESIPKVDKLFGPGNRYVTAAKQLVAQDCDGAAIDMPAGPSEVMIYADDYANPAFVAADLLAQAEHGSDSQVFLLCDSEAYAAKVTIQLTKQLATLSRQAIITQVLQKSAILVCNNQPALLQLINTYAPEHLILNRLDASAIVKQIKAAGTVFVGALAAETLGDYLTGSNHVLPTNGYAKNYSGLTTADFMLSRTIQKVSKRGIQSCGESAYTLASIEGLDAHAQAIKLRMLEE